MNIFTEKEIETLKEMERHAEKMAVKFERIERRLNKRSEKLFSVNDELGDKLEDVAGECGHIAGQLRYRVASEIIPLILSAR